MEPLCVASPIRTIYNIKKESCSRFYSKSGLLRSNFGANDKMKAINRINLI